MMQRQILIALQLALLGFSVVVLPTNTTAADANLRLREPDTWSLSELEKRLDVIDNELDDLASLSLRTGLGSLGYRSASHPTGEVTEWIQVDWKEEMAIDQVVIVPAIWRDTETGFRADGLPVEFRVLVGGAKERKAGRPIARFTAQDGLLPRIAPIVIPCSESGVTWVRLEATQLSQRAWDGRYELQLAEIFVFRGSENVALHQTVTTSTPSRESFGARDQRFLTDGFVPYLMDAAHGDQSIAFVSGIGIGNNPSLTIDLQASYPITQLNLHSVDLSDTIPQTTASDFCIPKHFRFEGATLPDFSDAVVLLEDRIESVFETGPILSWRFPKTNCRYVRLTALEPYVDTHSDRHGTRIGFAEIEVLSDGRNIAMGKPVRSSFDFSDQSRQLQALTDGRNLYGAILHVKAWLNELSRRHDLQIERPLIETELNIRYQRHAKSLYWSMGIAGFFAIGIPFTFLVGRMIRMRQVAEIQERFAADLHDEIGANVHAIGLLGELAKDSVHSPPELGDLLDEVCEVSKQTNASIRSFSKLQNIADAPLDLPNEMRLIARRVLAGIACNLEFEGVENLRTLKPRVQTDLLLFFKESLINTSRHSGATDCNIRLAADGNELSLTVIDNGRGFQNSLQSEVPASLQRRAKLMGGRVTAGRVDDQKTFVRLNLQRRRWPFSLLKI